MNRHVTVRFGALVAFGVALGLAALVLRRPALAAFAIVPWLTLAIGIVSWRWPEINVETSLTTPRVIEGDVADVVITVSSDRPLSWLDVEFEPGRGLRSADGIFRRVVTVPQDQARRIHFPVSPLGWGVFEVGRHRIVARDRFGLFSLSTITNVSVVLRSYPSGGRLRGMAQPTTTGTTLGVHLSPLRGDGCEYADVRPWQPGDRRRDVNWRVGARRQGIWVNERHPERTADAVLVLDDTATVGPAEDDTLRRAVQAALSLAEGHIGAQDRVGLAALGAPVRWLRPRAGTRQLYSIVDTLLDCRATRSGALGQRGLALGGLRPGTTIVVLSVLADDRIVDTIAELRQHGHQVVVVVPQAPPPPGSPTDVSRTSTTEPAGSGEWTGASAHLARALWDRLRDGRRTRLATVGVPVLDWDGVTPLSTVLDSRILAATARRG